MNILRYYIACMQCKIQNYLHFIHYTPKFNNNKMVSQQYTQHETYEACE